MAKMGNRAMTGKGTTRGRQPEVAALSSSGLAPAFAEPVHIQLVAIRHFAPTVQGAPIMREGFITGTGFLLGHPK